MSESQLFSYNYDDKEGLMSALPLFLFDDFLGTAVWLWLVFITLVVSNAALILVNREATFTITATSAVDGTKTDTCAVTVTV